MSYLDLDKEFKKQLDRLDPHQLDHLMNTPTSYENTHKTNIIEMRNQIIEQDLVSPTYKKLVKMTRTADELQEMTKGRVLQKQLDLDGYHLIQMDGLEDGDSGNWITSDGSIKESRLTIPEHRFDSSDLPEDIIKSNYKQRYQPEFVARLTGKQPHELTESDYRNVYNYHHQMSYNKFTGKELEKYDPSRTYSSVPKKFDQPIEVLAKSYGKDMYDRELFDLVDPKTGERLLFDLATNAHLNSHFDPWTIIDTEYNRKRLENHHDSHMDLYSIIKNASDSDNRIKEDWDILKSTAYQTAARALQYGPDFLVDSEKWKKIANAETGQMLADAWAGVKPSTRRAYTEGMLRASDAWDKGDHVGAILGWATQMDRLFMESATQMGLMLAGTAAVSVLGPEVAAGAVLTKLGVSFMSATLAGTDKTLMTMEEFKQNNKGKAMPADQVALAWAINTATLIPEAFLLGINLSAVLPKGVSSKLFNLSKLAPGPLATRGRAFAASVVGEAIQEGPLEESTENWLARDREENRPYIDFLTDSEVGKSAIIGGMMGGAMSALFGGVTLPFSSKKFKNRINAAKQSYEERISYNPMGQEINKEEQAVFLEQINNHTFDFNSPEGFKASVEALLTIHANPKASVEVRNQAQQKASQAVMEMVEGAAEKKIDLDNFAKVMNLNKEQLVEYAVYHSDMNAEVELANHGGQQLSKSRKEALINRFKEFAEALGVDAKKINAYYYADTLAGKPSALVDLHVKWGNLGYETYTRQINTFEELLENTTDPKERAKLEEDIASLVEAMHHLLHNQNGKIEGKAGFIDALQNMSRMSGVTTGHVTFPATKFSKVDPDRRTGFDIHISDLLRFSSRNEGGMFKVTNSIFRDIREMTERLQEIVARHDFLDEKVKKGELIIPDLNSVEAMKTEFDNAVKTAAARVAKDYQEDQKGKTHQKSYKAEDIAKLLYNMETRPKTDRLLKSKQARNIILDAYTMSEEKAKEVEAYIEEHYTKKDKKEQTLRRLREIRANKDFSEDFFNALKEKESSAREDLQNYIDNNLVDDKMKTFLAGKDITKEIVEDEEAILNTYFNFLENTTANKSEDFYKSTVELMLKAKKEIDEKLKFFKAQKENTQEASEEVSTTRITETRSTKPTENKVALTRTEQILKKLTTKLKETKAIIQNWTKERMFFDTETDFIGNKIHQIGYVVSGIKKTLNIRWEGTEAEFISEEQKKKSGFYYEEYQTYEEVQKKNKEAGTLNTLAEAILTMKEDYEKSGAKGIVGFNNSRADNVWIVNQLLEEQKNGVTEATEAVNWFHKLVYGTEPKGPVNADMNPLESVGDLRLVLAELVGEAQGSDRKYVKGALEEYAKKVFEVTDENSKSHSAQDDAQTTMNIVDAIMNSNPEDMLNKKTLLKTTIESRSEVIQAKNAEAYKRRTNDPRMKALEQAKIKAEERASESVRESLAQRDTSILDNKTVQLNTRDRALDTAKDLVKRVTEHKIGSTKSIRNLASWMRQAERTWNELNVLLKTESVNEEVIKAHADMTSMVKQLNNKIGDLVAKELDLEDAKGILSSIKRLSNELRRFGVQGNKEYILYSKVLERINLKTSELIAQGTVKENVTDNIKTLITKLESLLERERKEFNQKISNKPRETTIIDSVTEDINTSGLTPNSPVFFTYGSQNGARISFYSIHEAFEAFKTGRFNLDTYEELHTDPNIWNSIPEQGEVTNKALVVDRLTDIILEAINQNPHLGDDLFNTGYNNLKFSDNYGKYVYKEIYEEALTKARRELQDNEDIVTKALKNQMRHDIRNNPVFSDFFNNMEVHFTDILVDPFFRGPVKDAHGKVIKPIDYVIRQVIENVLNIEGSLVEGYTDREGGYRLSDQLSSTDPSNLLAIIDIIDRTATLDHKQTAAINEIISRVLDGNSPAMSILSTQTKRYDGSDILSPKSDLKKKLVNSPHMRLLYRFIEDGYTRADGRISHLDYNERVLVVIDQAAHEWLATTNMHELFSPSKDDTLKANFGFKSSEAKGLESQLRDVSTNYGITTDVIIDNLGRIIVDSLGITEGSDATRNLLDYNKIRKGLGAFALQYIEAMGWVENVTFNPEDYYQKQIEKTQATTELLEKELVKLPERLPWKAKNINLVRIKKDLNSNTNSEIDKARDRFFNTYKPAFILKNNREARPLERPVQKEHGSVRNTRGYNTVSWRAQEILNHLRNEEYIVNLEIIDALRDNLDTIKAYLGYNENVETDPTLSYPAKDSQRGINRSIDEQISQLLELADANKSNPDKGWFFDWFVAVNQRFHIDSNHANMQQNKSLQRFLMLPKSARRVFDYTDTDTIKTSSYAIAQAFDALGTEEDIIKVGEAILALNEKAVADIKALILLGNEKGLVKVLAEQGIHIGGIENLGQALHVINHLEDKLASKGGSFESTLVYELDSTTSGYLIRLLQIPTEDSLKDIGPSVGVFLKDASLPYVDENGEIQSTSISKDNRNLNALKKISNFFDVYELTGVNLSEKLAELDITDDAKVKEVFGKNGLDIEYSTELFQAMQAALPTAETVTKGNKKVVEEVSKAIRELVKNPTMIFNYASGKSGVIGKVTNAIKDDFIATYLKIKQNGLENVIAENPKDEARLRAINNTMEKLNKGYKAFLSTFKETLNITDDSFIAAIQSQPLNTIMLKVEAIEKGDSHKKRTEYHSLDDVFKVVLEPSYGEFMWQSLEERYGHFKKYNDAMNYVFRDMSAMFEYAYKFKMEKLIESKLRKRNPEYDSLSKKEKETLKAEGLADVTAAEERSIILDIYALMPNMRTPFSSYMDDRLMVTDIAIVPGDTKAHQIFSLVETVDAAGYTHISNMVEYANSVKFRAAALAGAVLPIHMLDASMLHSLIENYAGMMPIHDAVIIASQDASEIARAYNENAYVINKEYDMFGTLVEDYQDKLAYFQKHFEDDIKDNNDKYSKRRGSLETRPINDGFGKDVVIGKETLTVSKLLTKLDELNGINQKNRDLLKNIETVSNMSFLSGEFHTDGVINILNQSRLQNQKGKRKNNLDILGSSYLGLNPASNFREVLLDGLNSAKDRVNFIDKLQDLAKAQNNKVETDEYINHVKGVMKSLNLENLLNTVVEYTNEVNFNVAEYNPNQNTITLGLQSQTSRLHMDSVTKLSVLSDKSAVEMYVHECIHGALAFAFNNLKTFRIYKEVNQLQELYRAASEVITWEDFMPEKDSYDTSLQEVYEKHAKDTWEYIFNNKNNVTRLAGVQEFAAFGLTHKSIIKKLQETQLKARERKNEPLANRLLSLVKTIFDVIFGGAKIRELFPAAHEVFKGNRPVKQQENMYVELAKLTENLSKANHRAISKLLYHPARLADAMFSLVETLRVRGNKMLSPLFNKASNIVDEFGLEMKWMPKYHKGFWYNSKPFLGLLLTPFSESRRKSFNLWAGNHLRLQHEGLIQTLFKEVTAQDAQTSNLMKLSAMTRHVEQVSMEIENALMAQLREEFGKPLNDLESASITHALLKTDLSSLLITEEGSMKTNIDEIMNLIQSSTKVQQEIDVLRNILGDHAKGNFLKSQALGLALYMVEGVANPTQAVNVNNILKLAKITENKEEIAKQVDKLVSLYALQMTDDTYKKVLLTLKKDALNSVLRTHKQLNSEILGDYNTSDKTLFNKHKPEQYVKGQIKNLTRTSIDVKVDLLSRQAELAKQGYKLVETFKEDEILGKGATGLYKKILVTPNRRDGAALMPTGAQMIGTTITNSVNEYMSEIAEEYTPESYQQAYDKIYDRAHREKERVAKLMDNKELTLKELKELSSNYAPVINAFGNVIDFISMIPHSMREEYTNQDMDGITVLGKMFSNRHIQMNSSQVNSRLFDFLYEDMKNNMDTTTNRNIREGVEYVRLDSKSDVKFLQEAWNFIPPEFKQKAKDTPGGLWIRRDWLLDLLGTPQMTVSNAKVVKAAPYKVQAALKIGEVILKWVAGKAKRNIIMLIPQVLTRNIISNLNISIASGNNPVKVIARTISNAKALVDFLDTKKELNRIEFKRRIGTATKSELARISMLEGKLEHNPVKPLIDKGMYQAIIEELDMKNMEGAGELIRLIQDTKTGQRIPKWMKKAATHAFMEKGSFIYDFMYTLTSYSDFVSRATEYQLRMEKKGVPTEWEYSINKDGKRVKKKTHAWMKYEEGVTNDVWHAFINYDKPQSKIEQYANDIGVVMFTKYAKRIQHFITKTAIQNPMGVMMTLFGLHSFGFIETIYEHQFMFKKWGNLFYNPITDNIPNAIVPMWLQYLTGMRPFKVV